MKYFMKSYVVHGYTSIKIKFTTMPPQQSYLNPISYTKWKRETEKW